MDKQTTEETPKSLPKKSDVFKEIKKDASHLAKDLSRKQRQRRVLSWLVRLRLLSILKFIAPHKYKKAGPPDIERSSYAKVKSSTFGLAKIPIKRMSFPKSRPLRINELFVIGGEEEGLMARIRPRQIIRRWVNGSHHGIRRTIAYGRRGYYITYRDYTGEHRDIALIPTILSAVKKDPKRRRVEIEDIKLKIRAGRQRLILIIILDASDSMRPFIPMIVKLLVKFHNIAWKMRNLVGLITCYEDKARINTYPTTNINKILRGLMNVVFTGKTPLAKGLLLAHRLLISQRIKNPDAIPRILLISDGLANTPFDKPLSEEIRNKVFSEAQADVLATAKFLGQHGVKTIIINPWHLTQWYSRLFISPTDLLMKVAEITGGIYMGIDVEKLIYRDKLSMRYRRLKKEEVDAIIDSIIASIFESLP